MDWSWLLKLDWWLAIIVGAVLSIPISILGNVLTPKYLDFVARRGLSQRRKRAGRLMKEYEEIKLYSVDRNKLILKLCLSGIDVLVLVSMICLAIIVLVAGNNSRLAPIMQFPFNDSSYIYIELFFVILSAVLVVIAENILTKARDLIVKVDDFEKYEKEVFDRMAELRSVEEDIKN